jgi:hypothetical protein
VEWGSVEGFYDHSDEPLGTIKEEHKSPPLELCLCQLNLAHTFAAHFFKFYVAQSGLTFSSLRPRIVFPLDPRAKKPLLAQFLKTNKQFSLPLTMFIIQK